MSINRKRLTTFSSGIGEGLVTLAVAAADKLGDGGAFVLGMWLWERFVQPHIKAGPEKAEHIRINNKPLHGMDADSLVALVKEGPHAGLQHPPAARHHTECNPLVHASSLSNLSSPPVADPCHYPGTIPAEVAAIRERLTAMEEDMHTIAAQMETVTALLSGALRSGIEKPIHKKAG